MTTSIDPQHFVNSLILLMDEAFDNADNKHTFMLDKGTSLFHTLETISAEEASIPVGGKCASLAAQVAHIIFYLELLERRIQGDTSAADWNHIWNTVEKVTAQEWEEYKSQLRAVYERMVQIARHNPEWNESTITGALTILAHSMYHLGEIRQALCTLKN